MRHLWHSMQFSDISFFSGTKPVRSHRVILECFAPELILFAKDSNSSSQFDISYASTLKKLLFWIYLDKPPKQTKDIENILSFSQKYKLESIQKKVGKILEGKRQRSYFQTRNGLLYSLNNEISPDVNIKIGSSTTLSAHKSILSSRCHHFRSMFESGMKENISNTITISEAEETEASAFKNYLIYLYSDRLPPFKNTQEVIDLFYLSDLYYNMTLMKLCERELMRRVSKENVDKVPKFYYPF